MAVGHLAAVASTVASGGNIIGSWLVTLPAGAALSVLFFFILKAYFTA